jgi:hypothetical protein
VTWQDELRQLDEELAAGRLSAEDYRRQRDELLSQSASAAGPRTSVGPSTSVGLSAQPQPEPPGNGPFPPPFRWEQPPEEKTQAIRLIRDEADDSPDTTQVVRTRESNDAERTQVVPRPAIRPPPVHAVPSWQPREQLSPWGSMELPPTTDTTPAWFRQGPEVFESGGGPGRGRMIAIVAATVAVVLIVGAIVFVVVQNYQSNPTSPGAQTTTTDSPETGEPPRRLLGNLVGEVDKNATGPTTLDSARGKQFSPEEADFMAICGADQGEAQVLYRGFWYTQVHVFACADPTKAAAVTDQLFRLQERYGLRQRDAINGLSVVQLDNSTDVPDVPVVGRIFYSSGKDLVRIEVRGKTPQDVTQGLSEVTKALAANYPAG